MAHVSDLIAQDIEAYLHQHEHKSLLRFITCGSVDDGKSTLIGRLLYDSKMIFEDQLAALEADSKKVGTQGGELDFALLVDGLAAEREQGITIDVAYRFFSTDKRKFIVADTPGHEQYTRNMVTGASTAQVAVILIDARKGILTQTRRHSYLVSLVGIRHIVLAVNKMDLVDYSAARFHAIREEYETFAKDLGFADITAIPISALEGDNVLEKSAKTPWHAGPTLMTYLETVQVDDEAQARPFRLPVQWVNRPDLDFRGFAGTIASGRIRPGDEIVVAASGKSSKVARIVTMDGDLAEAVVDDRLVPPGVRAAIDAGAQRAEGGVELVGEDGLETVEHGGLGRASSRHRRHAIERRMVSTAQRISRNSTRPSANSRLTPPAISAGCSNATTTWRGVV